MLFSVLCAAFMQAQVLLHPNRGQWDDRIQYKVELQRGNMYVENAGFTYLFHNVDHDVEDVDFRMHAIKQVFIGASENPSTVESKPSSAYRNYFLGSDQSRWKSNVYSYASVKHVDQYPGIDLLIDGSVDQLKYSWVVKPGTSENTISWKYDGATSVEVLPNGKLKVEHIHGYFEESKPIAWVVEDGKKRTVSCSFVINDGVVSFQVDGERNLQETLVIDPSLVFSSFTGSTSDNWGFTATPDYTGNLVAGGIVFGAGYPVTSGVFDGSYNSPAGSYNFDVGITKFNATGTNLVFSTYLGGNQNETPHSMISDVNGDLYVFGVTASANFPMAGSSFDNSYNGGPTVVEDNVLTFNGSDLYIAKFNANGTSLLASTFVGGTGTDGINQGTMNYNYGDQFRGEITVDGTSVYIASVTSSLDFPVVLAAQPVIAGAQDAVLLKMNKSLSAISWSTYYGSSGADSGNGVQVSSSGSVFITGGTAGQLNFGGGGVQMGYSGGRDGYVARFNGTTGVLVAGTYMGTSAYDQSYFVQLDADNNVYIYGQTEGFLTPSPGVYSNPGSGQFIAKYNLSLNTQLWVTRVGAGTGNVEISPTAFLVSNCKDIYVTGWGGSVNSSNSQAILSSSNGFPVTPDAYQSNTNGSNFWLAVLDADAAFLKYATYFGGTSSSYNHVDGGTSRFDKNGSIYHAVCGACGGSDFGFTTTPGAWSPNNQSTNCNLAAFKFDLNKIEAVVAEPDPLICLPDPVIFNNNSANGNDFYWNFGDGTFSTEINPSHVYAGPGQYTVTLVVTDTNECFAPDSIEFIVNIGDFQGGVVDPDVFVCNGQTAQLEAFGGATYVWSPAQYLNNANIPNPVATVSSSTLFSCIISDSCGVDTVQVQVTVGSGSVTVSNDTTICLGNSVPLFVTGISSATWSPPTYLDNPNSFTPTSTPSQSITYTVTGTTVDGCPLSEQVNITVFFNPPQPIMPDTLSYCNGTSGTVTVGGGDTYLWSPGTDISSTTSTTVTISSAVEQYYYCDFTNACGTIRDSIYIDLVIPVIAVGNDTIVCPGEPAFFHASGAASYAWLAPVTPVTPNYSEVSISSYIPLTLVVVGTDQYGCMDTDSVHLDLFPQPFIQTNPDVFGILGEPVQLTATSTTSGPYVWSPAEFLSCVVCTSPVAQPDQNFVYTVSYTDQNGCSASDQVRISYDPIIYVPNAFTPDGMGSNDQFFALGSNIKDFRLDIFNRWGELIYTGDALSKTWDGTYDNLPCPDGVYVWKITYTGFSTDDEFHLVGHVSLLR